MTVTVRERIARSRENARTALDVYHGREGADEYLTDLGDLVTDLLHLADELDEDSGGEGVLRLAVGHFRDERDADPEADRAAIETSALEGIGGVASAMRKIEAERAHRERRRERVEALVEGERRDDREEADYADGVRFGLDLALSILRREAL